ncbi:Transcriptional regulator, contains XRE-family HTH domain [Friedmanniella luteola]|uniref:Transcriptional regulator, contains XRE-family HTH domain n=1 Tax=Friedmanniella luteola TaxID=546871 RepID=A0A1H1XPE7_9ACTN|nr:helix-turn-helix transcriptional regulator [Friedmanniella luteola]SDT11103.1 Transcriptional regulator, contains XRE-family HTH domain [Friedmanniella luteola]
MVSASIGERVAIARRRRGLSQAVLANLIGRSESWLSQVERGVRSVDRLPVLMDLAEVLHVEVEALLGRPWKFAPNGTSSPDELSEVRHYLNGYAHLFPFAEADVSLPDLKVAITDGHTDYQGARYARAATNLTGLLTAADVLDRRPQPHALDAIQIYVSGYLLAAKLLCKLGAAELAMLAADRAASAAMHGDSEADRLLTGYQVVAGLLRADQVEDAEALALRLVEPIAAPGIEDNPDLLSAAGSLWLLTAVIAARRTEKYEALRRLDQATVLAELLGRDANYGWTAFGPTNVAIHRVSVAAELGDPGEALAAAALVHLDQLPNGLTGRRAQLHVELAWANAQGKRDSEATLHLLEAEKIAPQLLRYNPLVREHIREMLARSKSSTTMLHDLAVRAGVLD